MSDEQPTTRKYPPTKHEDMDKGKQTASVPPELLWEGLRPKSGALEPREGVPIRLIRRRDFWRDEKSGSTSDQYLVEVGLHRDAMGGVVWTAGTRADLPNAFFELHYPYAGRETE